MQFNVTNCVFGESPEVLLGWQGVRDLLHQVKVGRDFYIGETG